MEQNLLSGALWPPQARQYLVDAVVVVVVVEAVVVVEEAVVVERVVVVVVVVVVVATVVLLGGERPQLSTDGAQKGAGCKAYFTTQRQSGHPSTLMK
jgi:hypothetical protein